MAKNKTKRLLESLGFGGPVEDGKLRLQTTMNAIYQRLYGIGVSVFDYEGLPEEIDSTILEKMLFNADGPLILTRDDALDKFILLNMAPVNKFDIYGQPLEFDGVTRYNLIRYPGLNRDNSVLIYDNVTYHSMDDQLKQYAQRLAICRMTMDSNMYVLRQQFLVKTRKETKTSVDLALKSYDNFKPATVVDETFNDHNSLEVLDLKPKMFLPELRQEYTELWNEALTMLGVPNITGTKRERMITDEVDRSIVGAIASQYMRLQTRETAMQEIKRVFGLDVTVNYRESLLEGGESNGESLHDAAPDTM